MENNSSKKFISIRIKMAVITALAVLASLLVLMFTVLTLVDSELTRINVNHLSDIAEIIGNEMETDVKTLNYDNTKPHVEDVSIQGIDGAYCYVVSADGTIVYHPTKDKVGKSVENEYIKNVIAHLNEVEKGKVASATYEYSGDEKYAAYYVSKKADFLVIATADRKSFLHPVYQIQRIWILVSGIMLVLGIIYSSYMARKISRQIKNVSNAIETIADFDFTENDYLSAAIKANDESGKIARDVSHMKTNLSEIIDNIKKECRLLHEMALSLTAATEKSNETASNKRLLGANQPPLLCGC